MGNLTNTRVAFEVLESRRLLAAAPFSLSGPGVYPEDFRLTTFAAGVNNPLGMAQLSDGSILAATSAVTTPGGYFGSSVGQLVRYYDTNGDGVADGSQILANNLPGQLTDVRVQGDFVFVTSAGPVSAGVNPSITILALGSRVYRPLTVIDTLTFQFPQPWMHYTYGLATRATPGQSGSVDLFFNVGSQDDDDTTPTNLTTTLTGSDGQFTGTLEPDSIYKLTVTPGIGGPGISNLTHIAYGLRNAAGIAVNPTTGDLYFEDNGANGGADGNNDPQLAADELNEITARYIGKNAAPDFGFAHDYISEPSGVRVGSGAVQPVVAYTPVGGSFSEGPQDIAFTPSSWPAGLNDGVVAGFYGQDAYSGDGTVNTQNPVVFYGIDNKAKFDLIGNDVAALGHPTGLLSTSDSLFVSDISPNNNFDPASGVVYQITANPRIYKVSGVAFNDNNGDGVYDRGDTLQRYPQIYIDENGNGAYDAGVDRLATTSRSGAYSFTLPAGRFALRQLLPSNLTQTTAPYEVVRVGTARGYATSAGNINFGSRAPVAAAQVRATFSTVPLVDTQSEKGRVWDRAE